MSEVTESILFRQRLYQNFKQSGLLSQLKTTLRTNLLQKLQKPQQPSSSTGEEKKPLYLRDKFIACIVSQYLRKSRKEYTLSILLPESNLEEQDCLDCAELAEIINLNVDPKEEASFLESLIGEWVKFRATNICERSTQTDYSEPVAKKLEDIEKQYRPRMDYWKLIPSSKPTANQSSSFSQSRMEQKVQEEFQIEKKKMRRDLELSVKAQLQKQFASQYDSRTRQMQKEHERRLTELKNREKTILDSLQRKTKQVEQKARQVNELQMKMITKYQQKTLELEMEHKRKVKDLESKEKQFWKKEVEVKAKKRQYEDTIRLVKQKVVEQTLGQ